MPGSHYSVPLPDAWSWQKTARLQKRTNALVAWKIMSFLFLQKEVFPFSAKECLLRRSIDRKGDVFDRNFENFYEIFKWFSNAKCSRYKGKKFPCFKLRTDQERFQNAKWSTWKRLDFCINVSIAQKMWTLLAWYRSRYRISAYHTASTKSFLFRLFFVFNCIAADFNRDFALLFSF